MKFDSLLLNGILLILILLLWSVLFFLIKKEKYANFFIKLGGKIGRIYFLANDFLLQLITISWLFFTHQLTTSIFSFTNYAFIYTIIVLRYNNVYKRLLSISNNRKFSISLIIGVLFFIKLNELAAINQVNKAILIVLYVCLLLIPEKKSN